jgi:hypothetical protein
MPWLGIAIVVVALLALILALTRPRVTVVAPPASMAPSPARPSSSKNIGAPAGQTKLSAQVRVSTTLGQTIPGPLGDAAALLAKMGLPQGLLEEAKESLHRAEAACPRYPNATLVFSTVKMDRSNDPTRDGIADRLVLACDADPEHLRRWHADSLASLGWQREPVSIAAGETAADSYGRGSERLRLTIVDRALLSLPQGITAPDGQTIYEVQYLPGAP